MVSAAAIFALFLLTPALNIFSEKNIASSESMVSQILRHVTLAVPEAQENETEITEIFFFYSSCRKETDERKQADSISVKGGTCRVIPEVRAHSHEHLRSGAWLEGFETHQNIKSSSSNCLLGQASGQVHFRKVSGCSELKQRGSSG